MLCIHVGLHIEGLAYIDFWRLCCQDFGQCRRPSREQSSTDATITLLSKLILCAAFLEQRNVPTYMLALFFISTISRQVCSSQTKFTSESNAYCVRQPEIGKFQLVIWWHHNNIAPAKRFAKNLHPLS